MSRIWLPWALILAMLVPSAARSAQRRSARRSIAPRPPAEHTIELTAEGDFSDPGGSSAWITVRGGDSVTWTGLGRDDSIVLIAIPPGADIDPARICSHDYQVSPPQLPYNGTNNFTGPTRLGLAGIWALGPEGDKDAGTSYVEIPSADAAGITPEALPTSPCSSLRNSKDVGGVLYQYLYDEPLLNLEKFDQPGTPPSAPATAVDASGATVSRLCTARTQTCVGRGGICTDPLFDPETCKRCGPLDPPDCSRARCTDVLVDPRDPNTVPPGTHVNGLLDSTYANPDITGVVLRMRWKDLQYDGGGNVRFDWSNLDREIGRAIAAGKYVSLDVRAGMNGTPDWLFREYLDPLSEHKASWCNTAPCQFPATPPPGAGLVQALQFRDYYTDSGTCGSGMRLGSPGDRHYVAAYTYFLTALGMHLRANSRFFQAVVHVKASGANLLTSEAELPHHCDDERPATMSFIDEDSWRSAGQGELETRQDRVLDVFKKTYQNVRDETKKITYACECNTKTWLDAGYRPQQLYDYYAAVENAIFNGFAQRKAIGYQLIQDGFPRVDADTGGFLGDHLYRERLVDFSIGDEAAVPDPLPPGYVEGTVRVNECYATPAACSTPGEFPQDLETGVVYCSADALPGMPFTGNCNLALEPIVRASEDVNSPSYDLSRNQVEYWPCDRVNRPEDCRNSRTENSYPKGAAQAEMILQQGREGHFAQALMPESTSYPEGKYFIPQHSGIWPLPQEAVELEFGNPLYPFITTGCPQQLAAIPAPAAPPGSQFVTGEMGSKIADFPIVGNNISLDYDGCPNRWIVQAGVHDVAAGVPPQVTGFQTSNTVRLLERAESALFNLVYNSNAVFIELYEDVIWRAGRERGTGATAAALSPAGYRADGETCQYTGLDGATTNALCYSKSLSQWNEELHYRRYLQSTRSDTTTYPALRDPFPAEWRFTFARVARPMDLYYVNPSHCLADHVDPTGVAAANALGRIRLVPR